MSTPYKPVDLVKIYNPRRTDCVRFAVIFDHLIITASSLILRTSFDVFVAPAQARVQANFAKGSTLRNYQNDQTFLVDPASPGTSVISLSVTGVGVSYTWSPGERIYQVRSKPGTDKFEWQFESHPPNEGYLAGNVKLYTELNNPARSPNIAAEIVSVPGPRYTVLLADGSVPVGPGWRFIRAAVLKQMQRQATLPPQLDYILLP